MFFLAFLIAFFIVSLVEVLRSAFAPKVADVQLASALAPADVVRTPVSFADLAERIKPAVVNISTTKTFRQQGSMLRAPFGGGNSLDRFSAVTIFLKSFLVIFRNENSSKKALGQVSSSVMMATSLPIIMLLNRQTKSWSSYPMGRRSMKPRLLARTLKQTLP
jgi:S1-C subfamily serine protease